MTCPQCGSANAPGRRFCLECGTPLATACPACGAGNEPEAKFCGSCGTRLAGERAAEPPNPARPAPPAGTAAERRVVSVLFADLVGFTALAAERDPEAVREVLGRYFDLAREIVVRYGGTIEKFIGDAVMALWGAPTAHEDDAERAVRAALDIVDEIPRLGSGLALDLRVRAAVLTGEAAVTVGAAGQGMVAGDLVNAASRLQAAAAPGTVLVGEATRLAAGAAIAFEEAGEHALRGRPTSLAAWRALRVIAERGGSGRTDVLEPPFVGRADELRFLKEQFHATGREQRARLVSLVGQAGIGKSRLAWELEKYLDGVVEPVWWHRGRSPAYGEGITFWALGEMVRRRAGLAERDDEATTRAAVATVLARHVPDPAERHWIEPRLLALLGVGETPTGGREELFAAWRTFFERIAAEGTVALVVEDLQWSDDGMLDFLEHLLDWSRNYPIFVLTLSRPELFERRPGWGTERRGAISMRLEPLGDAPMRELLAGLAPGLPAATVARILERANGIPLYAVETVRMLAADGRLVPEGKVLRPSGDLGALEVPPTLRALVAARLDGLAPVDRTLLQDASVLGQSFTLPALAAVAGRDPASLEPQLDAMVRRELLVVETDPRAPTRGQHAFVQALVREVAYSTLALRDRKSRHLAAARYFESLGDDELAGALATQYLAAHAAAPEGPEAEAIAAQARLALGAAADRAEALGALLQAADTLRSALTVTPDPEGKAALLERIGWLEVLRSDYLAGEKSLVQAEVAWAALGDRVSALNATAKLATGHLSAANIARALATLEAKRSEAETLADRAVNDPRAGEAVARYAEATGRACFRSEQYEAVPRWTDLALRLAEPLRLDEIVLMALVTKGTALIYLGRRREGTALLTGAQIDARTRGQHLAALRAGVNLASQNIDIDPAGVLAQIREGMALAKRLGLVAFDAYHAGNAAGAAERTGDWAWLRIAMTDLAETHPDASTRAWILSCAEYLDCWTGEIDATRAAELLRSAEAQADPQTVLNMAGWTMRGAFARERFAEAIGRGRVFMDHPVHSRVELFMLGRVALHGGDLALARQVLEKLGPSPGGASDGDLASLRAGIAAFEGRTAEALAGYRSADAVYRDLGLRFDIALDAIDMAALVGAADPSVAAAATDARATLVELGAEPLVTRLDRLLATPSKATRRGPVTALAASDR